MENEPRSPRIRVRTWKILVAVALSLALGSLGTARALEMFRGAQRQGFACAGEARGIYLPCVTLRQGLDPTSTADLYEVFLVERRASGLEGNWQDPLASITHPESLPPDPRSKYRPLASMYPVTAALLLRPLCGSGLEAFVYAWRPWIFVTFLVGIAAAGLGGSRGPWMPLGAAVALWVALEAPMTERVLHAGQANLAVAGVFGLVLAALALDQRWLAAVLATLGAAIKLVPAVTLWPIVCSRSWRSLLPAALLAAALLLAVAAVLPLPVFFADLWGILEVNTHQPSGLHRLPGPWIPVLDTIRVLPLLIPTATISGLCAWRAVGHRDLLGEVIATGAALLMTWVGLNAVAATAGYASLGVPSACFLLTWPFHRHAPGFAWLLAPLGLVTLLLYPGSVLQVTDLPSLELPLVLGGLCVWAGLLVRLLWVSRANLGRRDAAIVGGTLLLACGWSWAA